MKTFNQLREEVLRYYDLASEDSGADVDLAGTALNQANANRSIEHAWPFMLSRVYTLSVVAGQQEYILPHTNFRKIQLLWSDTNRQWGRQLPPRQIPYIQDLNFQRQEGAAEFYELIDPSVVAAQPADADTLTITSSDAEVTSPTIYIEGEDADGNVISETLGKDDVSVNEYARITYYAKEADWEGTLTIMTTVGAETLLTLGPTEYQKEYPVIKWQNIPGANETWQYRYLRVPRVMTRDFDKPDIPYPLSNILVYDALLDLATYNELDSESVNIWRSKQQECLNNLYELKLTADSIAGEPEYINIRGE